MESFRESLKRILSKKEQSQAIYGFDVLGDMALIEIPAALQTKKKKIAQTLLDTQQNVTRVYEKIGEHEGKYRVEKIAWLAGKKDSVAHYKEWGCVFHFDPGTVFFNPRLGTERQRVAEMVSKNKTTAVFFAGVGPYAIQIAKHRAPKKVYAVEWNPAAKPFFILNAVQNKVNSLVQFSSGDISKIPPKAECDHVVLPAPETALDYLDVAMKWISPKGGMIHLYLFAGDPDAEKNAREKVLEKTKSFARKTKIAFIRKVSDFSPSKRQFCVRVKVLPLFSRAKPSEFKKKK